MPTPFSSLPHTGIQSLTPYQPGKSIASLTQETGLTDIIKLASNENPLGCSPLVREALQQLTAEQIAAYPSPLHHPLHAYLTQQLQIDAKQLLFSNGSDAFFSLLMTTFALHTGKFVLTHDYAFNAYEIQAQTLGIPLQKAGIHPDWSVNIENLINLCNAQTALLFIANPNNPTGQLIPAQQLKYLLTQLPETCLLVLDEAYIEYTEPEENTLLWLKKHSNLVLLRTFSKIYGMAGLRLGYAIAHPEIIHLLQRAQLPFTVNQAVMSAACAALKDTAFIQRSYQMTHQGLKQLATGLKKLGLIPLPSHANFITVDCRQPAQPIYEKLLAYGIIVRPLSPYGLPNHLRITIGTPEQIVRVLNALSLILEECR